MTSSWVTGAACFISGSGPRRDPGKTARLAFGSDRSGFGDQVSLAPRGSPGTGNPPAGPGAVAGPPPPGPYAGAGPGPNPLSPPAPSTDRSAGFASRVGAVATPRDVSSVGPVAIPERRTSGFVAA